jgi:hypothetical protein
MGHQHELKASPDKKAWESIKKTGFKLKLLTIQTTTKISLLSVSSN